MINIRYNALITSSPPLIIPKCRKPEFWGGNSKSGSSVTKLASINTAGSLAKFLKNVLISQGC